MKHQWITDPRIGQIVPTFMQEVTPRDTWQGRSTAIFRLAPLDFPAYMSLNIFVSFFFVPYRIVWDEFEDVITGADTTTPWPTKTYSLVDSAAWSKFGLGVNAVRFEERNVLPIRAYNKICNDHFDDQNKITPTPLDTVGIRRCRFPSSDYYGGIEDELQQGLEETIDTTGANFGVVELREKMARQRIRERRAEYGEKYRDMLMADYGIRLPDRTLDQPERLCTSKTTMGISEVVATATSTTENTGDYRGHGIAGMNINFPKKHFQEHGMLMGVMYSRPRLLLRERADKIFLTTDKEDIYNPLLVNDAPTAVNSDEIDCTNAGASFNYGYQSRYEHLRSPRDTCAGNLQNFGLHSWTAGIFTGNSVPPIPFMQEVQDYDQLFQDQSANRNDLISFFNHGIGKTSVIKPRKT